MIQALSGVFPFMTLIIAIYYAGELVWRERERRTHEIIDATPVPDWTFVAPKTLAITLVLTLTLRDPVFVVVISAGAQGLLRLPDRRTTCSGRWSRTRSTPC